MSIEEIKDIKKLQKRLKSALEELKYIKKCCENAGLELAKHSFSWDGKEKNLVIQALELNERFEHREQALDEIKKYFKKECISCKEHYYNQHCKDCEIQYYLNIINKTKSNNNEYFNQEK